MTVEELLALNPFPGLAAFAPDEADLFFGRSEQIAELMRRVDDVPFVAVAGASGCGKSSLVLAGLLQALDQRAAREGTPGWRRVILRPGRQPIAHLAAPLATALGIDASPEGIGALYGRLRLSAIGLLEAVRLAALPAGERVFVVVDQFEEIFRYERMSDPEEAAAFVKLLLAAAIDRHSPVRVLITLRSDALGHCAEFPGLAEAVSAGQYLVPKLTRDQRKEAIVGPVARRGFSVRPSLVQRILNDVPDDFDDLPVMQHALARTWNHWARNGGGARDIEVSDYVAIGTSKEAIARHGDEVLASLRDLAPVVQGVMRALTERPQDGAEVRRPVEFDRLCEIVPAARERIATVVERLRRADTMFLRPPPLEPLEGNPVVDITHESLIRQWPLLRRWLQAEVEARAQLQRLRDAAARHAGGEGDLWRGRELQRALEWQSAERPTAGWVRLSAGDDGAAQWPSALDFLARSEAESRADRRRRTQIKWIYGTLGVAVVAAVAYGLFEHFARQESALQARLSQAQARSSELANRAWLEMPLDPALSAHLARAALELHSDNQHAERALRQSIETLETAHVERIFAFDRPISDASMNRDGSRIAVVGKQKLAILETSQFREAMPSRKLPWDDVPRVWLLSGQPLVVLQSGDQGVHVETLAGHPVARWNCDGNKDDRVFTVDVSPDEQWLAAGCLSGRLAMLRIPAVGQPVPPPIVLHEGNGGTVTAARFSSDSRHLASGNADGRVLLWQVAQPLRPLIGTIGKNNVLGSPIVHTQAIRDVDFWVRDDHSVLATASDDGTAVVWQLDLAKGRMAKAEKPADRVTWTLDHGRPVIRARFLEADAQGRLLTIADKRLLFWENEKPVFSRRQHYNWVSDAGVSPDLGMAVSAGDDGVARVWSRDGTAVATLRGHRDTLTRSFFLPDRRIVTASTDGTLRVWRIDAPEQVHGNPGEWMTSAAFSPDGEQIALCEEKRTRYGSSCRLVPTVAERPTDPKSIVELPAPNLPTFHMITSLSWDSTGTRIAGHGQDYDIYSKHGAVSWESGKPRQLPDVHWSYERHTRQALSVDKVGRIQVRDQDALPGVEGPAKVQLSAEQDSRSPMTMSPDGRWIAAVNDKRVALFDVGSPQAEPRWLEGHQGSVMNMAFSPDSKLLATASADRTARLWPVDSGSSAEPIELTGGHSATVYWVAFHPAGKQLATAGADGSVRLWKWDAGKGIELASLEWHNDVVNEVRFHPTDSRLLTASDDGTVKLGRCKTCDSSTPQLLLRVDKLAQLTEHDQKYLKQALGDDMSLR